LFTETRITNISVIDREMSPKFDTRVDFDLKVTKNVIETETAMSRPPSLKIDVTS